MALDYSLPLAQLLREGTAAAHHDAENSKGAGWLVRAELDKEEYARFLMMLWHVYDNLEKALDRHSEIPALQSTYNPTLLARAPSLAADIAYLLDVPESSWKSHPIHVELSSSPPPALAAYTSRIQQLADAADPSPLLGHAYVRYLGDLSGGQVIRRRVAKAYGLDGTDGLSFYEFKRLGSNEVGTIGDHSKIKDWYREGMNSAGNHDETKKVAIVKEAGTAFTLNTGLFTELRPPTVAKLVVNNLALPPLGDPTTPSIEPFVPREFEVVMDRGPDYEPTVSWSTVLTFCGAVGLAHFLVVTSGVSGADAYAKVHSFGGWIASLLDN